MSVERTVTFKLPKNVDEFLEAYAKLLKYKSVEDFLKEEIEWHFGRESTLNKMDIYFDTNTIQEIQKRYGLEPSNKPKEKAAVTT